LFLVLIWVKITLDGGQSGDGVKFRVFMKKEGKRIALVFAGGTVLSTTERLVVKIEDDMEAWLDKVPEIGIMSHPEPFFARGEDDDLAGPVFWQDLTAKIHKLLVDFDGIVVISSLRDVMDNAIATTFALENLNKPVIFTGSLLPLFGHRSRSLDPIGLRANLINAMQAATMDLPAVCLAYGNCLIRAVKAQRTNMESNNVFTSSDDKYLARVDFGISRHNDDLDDAEFLINLKNTFVKNLLFLRYTPGLRVSSFEDSFKNSAGLLIDNPTTEISPSFIQDLSLINKPVAVCNRFSKASMEGINLISLHGLTKETAYIKMCWALGQTNDIAECRSLMLNDLRGEFI